VTTAVLQCTPQGRKPANTKYWRNDDWQGKTEKNKNKKKPVILPAKNPMQRALQLCCEKPVSH